MNEYDTRDTIRRAALHLDEVKPDWWSHIDPLTFNLADCNLCLCGQNGLSWTQIFRWDDGLPSEFSLVTCSRDDEPLWLEEIAKRMPVREPALV